MSKFNTTQTQTTKTINLAGGQAYSMTPELELASIVLTSFVNDKYYEKTDNTVKKVQELVNKVDVEFAAKLAVYARKEFGMRSITHVLAAEIANKLSGKQIGKKFYEAVIYRPDDMLEIIAYYKNNKSNKSLPASMKKGFRNASTKFSAYQLAKYRKSDKEVKMVDLFNLVHPKPKNEEQSEAFKALMTDTLRNTETWEAMLSEAGNSEDVEDAKNQAWKELISSKKIGYFALLRNLRNIKEQAPEVLDDALLMLTDKNLIQKSLVLPFRFDTAYRLFNTGSSEDRKIIIALNKAADLSMSNVPELPGRTLVVVDSSGSMSGKPADIASLFAAVLVKKNPSADLMSFSDDARYQTFNPNDSILTIKNGFRFVSGGTNFHSIFQKANKPYDRIIILSDMQGWIGYNTPSKDFQNYKKQYGVNPVIYSFDLAGYGTLQFPENNVYALAGFSDKIFDVMSLLETDKRALINNINSMQL